MSPPRKNSSPQGNLPKTPLPRNALFVGVIAAVAGAAYVIYKKTNTIGGMAEPGDRKDQKRDPIEDAPTNLDKSVEGLTDSLKKTREGVADDAKKARGNVTKGEDET